MKSINFERIVSDWAVRWFQISVALVWILAAAAKLSSITGDPRTMLARDAVLGIRNVYLFVAVAQLETIGACYLFFANNMSKKLIICTLGSALLLAYRIVLGFIDPVAPCNCLGSALAGIGLTAVASDRLSFAAVVYASIGCGACWLIRAYAHRPATGLQAQHS